MIRTTSQARRQERRERWIEMLATGRLGSIWVTRALEDPTRRYSELARTDGTLVLRTPDQEAVLKFTIHPMKSAGGTDDTKEDHEGDMTYRMARFFDSQWCPHVVLPYGRLHVTPDSLLRHPDIWDWARPKDGVPRRVGLLVTESAHFTLNDLLRNRRAISETGFCGLLLQVIWTLGLIRQRYPTWRHKDLHVSNILTERSVPVSTPHGPIGPPGEKFVGYEIGPNGEVLWLPLSECPWQARLMDFGASRFCETKDLEEDTADLADSVLWDLKRPGSSEHVGLSVREELERWVRQGLGGPGATHLRRSQAVSLSSGSSSSPGPLDLSPLGLLRQARSPLFNRFRLARRPLMNEIVGLWRLGPSCPA